MGRGLQSRYCSLFPHSRCRGGRGELGLVAEGWVGRRRRAATIWPGCAEPLALRAPSCERAGRWRAPAGSGPAPLSPARGPLSRGPAYARGPAAAAGAADVAL